MLIHIIASAVKEMIIILTCFSIVAVISAIGITVAEILRAERKDDNYD